MIFVRPEDFRPNYGILPGCPSPSPSPSASPSASPLFKSFFLSQKWSDWTDFDIYCSLGKTTHKMVSYARSVRRAPHGRPWGAKGENRKFALKKSIFSQNFVELITDCSQSGAPGATCHAPVARPDVRPSGGPWGGPWGRF